jgi:hypothetical protein
VYAKQKLSPLPVCGRLLSCLVVGFLCLCAPRFTPADAFEEAARALARKVAPLTAGHPVTFEFQNHSTLRGTPLSDLSTVFQGELQRRGTKIVPGKSSISIVLILAENPTAYLGVAVVRRGGTPETFMESFGPAGGSSSSEPSFTSVLRREPLFSTQEPILDVAFNEDEELAFAFGAQEIIRYERQDGLWKLTGGERIPAQFIVPRELRGFLFLGMRTQTAYSPAKYCQISFVDDSGWNCDKNSAAMPIRSVSADLLGKKNLGAWISAAQLGADTDAKIVVVAQGGSTRLYEEGSDPVASFAGWGSEIASLRSSCGGGWHLLVTGRDDWSKPDTIQAVEIQGRLARPVSPAMEFPGPVIALHAPGGALETIKTGSASAVAVIRNLQTGMYEAYRLTLDCAN